jgi:hypothetical protein
MTASELIIRIRVHESVDPALVDPQALAEDIVDGFNADVDVSRYHEHRSPIELVSGEWVRPYSAVDAVVSEAAHAVLANPVGARQRSVLQMLVRDGCWYPSCGWQYNTVKTTIEVLDTLVPKGLATPIAGQDNLYEITDVGREVLRRLEEKS